MRRPDIIFWRGSIGRPSTRTLRSCTSCQSQDTLSCTRTSTCDRWAIFKISHGHSGTFNPVTDISLSYVIMPPGIQKQFLCEQRMLNTWPKNWSSFLQELGSPRKYSPTKGVNFMSKLLVEPPRLTASWNASIQRWRVLWTVKGRIGIS